MLDGEDVGPSDRDWTFRDFRKALDAAIAGACAEAVLS
jgi:hypothetical protein